MVDNNPGDQWWCAKVWYDGATHDCLKKTEAPDGRNKRHWACPAGSCQHMPLQCWHAIVSWLNGELMCINIGGARNLKHRSHRELLFCVVAFMSSIGGLKLDVVCDIFKRGHHESVRMGPPRMCE